MCFNPHPARRPGATKPIIPDSHPASQFLNAEMAAWGAGTVTENADRRPRLKLAPDAEAFFAALTTTANLSRMTLELTLSNPHSLSHAQALRLMTSILTNAQAAYRLLRIAIGDPMFKPEVWGEAEDIAPIDTGILP